jgi:hypothetical protein
MRMTRTTTLLIAACIAGALSWGAWTTLRSRSAPRSPAAPGSPAASGFPGAPGPPAASGFPAPQSRAGVAQEPAAASGTAPAPGAPAAGASAAGVDTHAIATVLGTTITGKDKDNLSSLIGGPLFARFAVENKIEVTDAEIETFLAKMEEMDKQQAVEFEQMRQRLTEALKSPSLSDKDRKAKESQLQTVERLIRMKAEMKAQSDRKQASFDPMKRRIARETIRMWKINRALFQKYGGRVIFQQAGVEPIDAYRDFLKEQEKQGSFEILDKEYEAPFWKYFTDDSMHRFYKDADGAKVINTPWWLMKEQPAGQ